MIKCVRIAFTLFGDDSWTGGANYLLNVFSAINDLPCKLIDPVLFVSPNTNQRIVDDLCAYLDNPAVVVSGWADTKWNRIRQLAERGILQCDRTSLEVFRKAKIDVVFQNDNWYGFAFPIPTLVWIADFQHKHLRDMFSGYRRLKRDLSYSVLCKSATRIMVSSEDAANDCKTFFPFSRDKVIAVPFAVRSDYSGLEAISADIKSIYDLPARYFYFPGQLWRHKNHIALLEALRILKTVQPGIVVVLSGNPEDRRNPQHPKNVMALVDHYGLQDSFRFLGLVPYEHIEPLMKSSVAMINPSMFEGWSTTVEEAKSLGVPMLLSDLRVHREQAPDVCMFFDERDPEHIADVMQQAWLEWGGAPSLESKRNAVNNYATKRLIFAQQLQVLIMETANGELP